MIYLAFCLWLFSGQPHLLLWICPVWDLYPIKFHMVVYCGIVSRFWLVCSGRILWIALPVWCHHLLPVVGFLLFGLLGNLPICTAFWYPLSFLQLEWTVSVSFEFKHCSVSVSLPLVRVPEILFYTLAIFFLYSWVFSFGCWVVCCTMAFYCALVFLL